MVKYKKRSSLYYRRGVWFAKQRAYRKRRRLGKRKWRAYKRYQRGANVRYRNNYSSGWRSAGRIAKGAGHLASVITGNPIVGAATQFGVDAAANIAPFFKHIPKPLGSRMQRVMSRPGRGYGNTEVKHLEEVVYDRITETTYGCELNSTIETSTTNNKMMHVFQPAAGTEYYQRLGNSVRVIGLGVMLKLTANTLGSNHQYLRFIIFCDSKPAVSHPTPSQILDIENNASAPGYAGAGTGLLPAEETADVIPLNHWYKSHFRIIFDKQFHMIKDVSGDNERKNLIYFQTFIPMNKVVKYGMYNSVTKSTNVETTNRFHLLVVSTEATNYPKMVCRLTWKYYDD